MCLTLQLATLRDPMDYSPPGSWIFPWIGLPFPSPRDLPNPRIKPSSPALAGPALAGGFFTTATRETPRDLLGIKLTFPSAISSSSKVHYVHLVYLPLTKQLSITHSNVPSNWLKRLGKRQKSHMKMFNTVNNTLSPHFNISEVEVF